MGELRELIRQDPSDARFQSALGLALAGLGARVAVPTSLNVRGVDEHGWHAWAVPPEYWA